MSALARFAVLGSVVLSTVLLCMRPLGNYIADVMDGRSRVLRPRFERWLGRICGIDRELEMSWSHYAVALLTFNFCGALVVYALQRLQSALPLNPQKMVAVSADSAFNTAISFVTNTNWQSYSGESTMSYLVQMAGLTVQNFLSAATGLVVAIAVIRGFARHSAMAIGNFWVDLTRATLYVLLPLSAVLALLLVSQGVIQNFDPYKPATSFETAAGTTTKAQTLPMGPVASQESIKELGTNGGGFFNANSSHPFENPSMSSNLLETIAILLIPFALTFTFGKMVGDTRQGWALAVCMVILLSSLSLLAFHSEQQGQPFYGKGGDRSACQRKPVGWQHGRQGDSLRHCGVRPVCRRHHGDFLRRDQRLARFDEPHGRVRHSVSDAVG